MSGWQGPKAHVDIPDWGGFMYENEKKWLGIINPNTGEIRNYFET